MEKLSADNYRSGLLMDEEFMAGISEDPNQKGQYIAFVIDHNRGETLGNYCFSNLFDAIRELNAIPRDWVYTKIGACGGGNCGSGKCGTGGCGKSKTTTKTDSHCDTGQCD